MIDSTNGSNAVFCDVLCILHIRVILNYLI